MKRRRWWIWAIVWCVLTGCNRSWSSGDRVLVGKFLYETHLTEPRRFEVIVFKYPEAPVRNGVARNYIKRLLGLPGEILAIFFGQLFRMPAPPAGTPPYHDDLAGVPPDKRADFQKKLWIGGWQAHNRGADDYTHLNDEKSRRWFMAGKFEPVRKPPDVMLTMRRIVYDNDFPAKDLLGKLERWSHEGAWAADERRGFRHNNTQLEQQFTWLRYQHRVYASVLRPARREEPFGALVDATRPLVGAVDEVKPVLITDFMDYNSYNEGGGRDEPRTPGANWVGDLMLECELNVLEAKGELAIELSRGIYRYQARWDLSSGTCALFRMGPDGKEDKLDTKPTKINKKGTFQVRFANFDSRLTVWVDGALPFEQGHDYTPPEMPLAEEAKLSPEEFKSRMAGRCGPTKNDLQPASIGSRGAAVEVRHLKLWRDTHYTLHAGSPDAAAPDLSDPGAWDSLRRADFLTMYVQPQHYLALGDNSPASSDSREWGLVPQRLLLGRALYVYFPFDRFGPIR